jgi:hypothetical protein
LVVVIPDGLERQDRRVVHRIEPAPALTGELVPAQVLS